MALRVIDLCCGAGLFSAGMARAGLDIILGVDVDAVALSSFGANFPNAVLWKEDILNIPSLPECDIVIGGPPCQPFSSANRYQDTESGMILVNRFIELSKASGDRYWIMEEVTPVAEYVRGKVPRIEIWDCARFGALNLRARMFGGSFPDPVAVLPPCEDPTAAVMASECTLSIQEMRDLQGVPGWMVFNGSDSDQRRQIGNGVPLAVGEAIGKGILWDIANRVSSGHKSWHHTVKAARRERGEKRIYRGVDNWLYCEECDTMIFMGTPGTSRVSVPTPGQSGTPEVPSFGTPAPATKCTPNLGYPGTPRTRSLASKSRRVSVSLKETAKRGEPVG